MSTLEYQTKELKRRIDLKRQLLSLTEQRIRDMENELARQKRLLKANQSYQPGDKEHPFVD